MPSTTIHIPSSLLEVVDSRARVKGISRNKFILQALERVIEEDEAWSPGFLAELSHPLSRADVNAVDGMVEDIIASRRSRKSPPAL